MIKNKLLGFLDKQFHQIINHHHIKKFIMELHSIILQMVVNQLQQFHKLIIMILVINVFIIFKELLMQDRYIQLLYTVLICIIKY
jgi:hypothetical protein